MVHQLHMPHKHGISIPLCQKEHKKELFNLGRKRPQDFNNHYFNELEDHICRLVSLIRNCFFSELPHNDLSAIAKPRKTVCRTCEYKSICTYSDRFKGGF